MKSISKYLLLALTFLGSTGTMNSFAVGNIPPYTLDDINSDSIDYEYAVQPSIRAKDRSRSSRPVAKNNSELNNTSREQINGNFKNTHSNNFGAGENAVDAEEINKNDGTPFNTDNVPNHGLLASRNNEQAANMQSSNAKNINFSSSTDELRASTEKNITNSLQSYLSLAPYLAAFKKAHKAWDFFKKGASFDGARKMYFDLTLLPTIDEVKSETENMCKLLNLSAPSDDEIMSNYKYVMSNLVLLNEHLESILANLYNVRSQGQSVDVDAIIADPSKFVNHMLLSADSGSSSETEVKIMTSSSPEVVDISSLNKTDIQLATELFGNKIANIVTSKENDDNNAKYMIKKLNNESSQAKE